MEAWTLVAPVGMRNAVGTAMSISISLQSSSAPSCCVSGLLTAQSSEPHIFCTFSPEKIVGYAYHPRTQQWPMNERNKGKKGSFLWLKVEPVLYYNVYPRAPMARGWSQAPVGTPTFFSYYTPQLLLSQPFSLLITFLKLPIAESASRGPRLTQKDRKEFKKYLTV